GNGYDEILSYSRSTTTGLNVVVHRFHRLTAASGTFVTANFEPGHLATIGWSGAVSIQVGKFADFPDGAGRDDLMIFNHATRQLARVDSRVSPQGNTVFWMAFATPTEMFDQYEEVRVAQANEGPFDDVVVHNYYGGDNYRLSLSGTAASALPGSVVNGNLLHYPG
ncbi:MAG TPA: hypothetical protein VES20_03305, partial [Bryobacteraceae bacterium]|nr:hypothetical protein [Bryobacteraceae bacterium]